MKTITWMRRTTVALLCALLLLFGALPAAAQDSIIGLDPDSENLFLNMEHLLPGSVVTDYFTVRNNSLATCSFYLKASEAGDADYSSAEAKRKAEDLLSKLDLRVVVHNVSRERDVNAASGRLVYEGKANHKTAGIDNNLLFNSPRINLGRLEAGVAVIIEATVSVPERLGNEYEFVQGKFRWTFTAEEVVTPGSSSSAPDPGSSSSSGGNPPGSSGSSGGNPPASSSSSSSGGGNGGNGGNGGGGTTTASSSSRRPTATVSRSASRSVSSRSRSGGSGSVSSVSSSSSESLSIASISEAPPPTPPPPTERVWALLNLTLAVLGVICSVIMLVGFFRQRRKDQDKAKEEEEAAGAPQAATDADEGREEQPVRNKTAAGIFRILACIVGVVSIIVFFLTEDMRLKMAITDQWTWLMIVFTIAQILFGLLMYYFNRPKDADEDDDYDDEDEEI